MASYRSFIEEQFPVSKVSKESYKERKAGSGQTLTGLGKWWGRKPLVLIRAALLGLLLPVSNNPERDREIFLKILSMDNDGLILRKTKSIAMIELFNNLTDRERLRYFEEDEYGKILYGKHLTKKDKEDLQNLVFNRFSYDKKLNYCKRPEELINLPPQSWGEINAHLKTSATNLQELTSELGLRKFGSGPIVGDCFSGGGSVPFEAARMGCDIYASDLNPTAMLLTWASLNINCCSIEELKSIWGFQEKIFDSADKQIIDWNIEVNEEGDRANAYLYCNETICPECGWLVPLLPSCIIGKRTRTIAVLTENTAQGFDIEIKSAVESEEIDAAEQMVTLLNGGLYCPHCARSTPITALRKDRKKPDGSIEYGLRKWDASEFVTRHNDIYGERLYCIRYEKTEIDINGKKKITRYYVAPTSHDVAREEKVVDLLLARFATWQENGYLPSSLVEEGNETARLMREKGWSCWHQLFNPRQLLINGLLMSLLDEKAKTNKEKVVGLLNINKCVDWNSKLSRWENDDAHTNKQTFYNQAFNTLFNYSVRAFRPLSEIWFTDFKGNFEGKQSKTIKADDARNLTESCNIWITDPPYADAVNYHELSEFFLAWDKKMLIDVFPDWYADSKRALAVRGKGESFNQSMVEIYQNLAKHMPDNGVQIVMFTHQDVSVWADLTLILWASGLKVTAAWNIATETDASGLKQGNYVKGTVLLVLRKQNSDETVFSDELYTEIEVEVGRQINHMRDIDDKDDPNFNDADYLLAAYAASLKVLTSYKQIGDIDVFYELTKPKSSTKNSPIEKIINNAVKIAYDYLTPSGFELSSWKTYIAEERFYIKGLDIEKENIYQIGAYQELARGFGVKNFKEYLASTKANQARLKTAIELGMRGLGGDSAFSNNILRNVFAALHQAVKEEDANIGKSWLKNELPDYWGRRIKIIEILEFLSSFEKITTMSQWHDQARFARYLVELVRDDGV